MQQYILICYFFVLIAIAEYACILLMHHIHDLEGAAAKLIDCISGSVICLSFMICNVIFVIQ